MRILGKGNRPVSVAYFRPPIPPPPPDILITIDANDDRAAGRLNSDGNYYTITFPDDYLGGVDLFASARDGSGKIGTGVDASANLDIIFNIPVGMSIGANTSDNIIPLYDGGAYPDVLYSDPSIHLKLDTDEWDSSILGRLNITVNNYGVIIGAGGSGGWGGMIVTGTKAPFKYFGWEGAGGGQGLHPAWDDPPDALGDYYDPADTSPGPAGQGGSGYGRWLTGSQRPTGAFAANGESGTMETGGVSGFTGRPDATRGAGVRAGRGHWGGTVIYITSDVGSATDGTHLNIYNNGWMSAGAGGGSGSQVTSVSGVGGSWGPGGTNGIGGDGRQFSGPIWNPGGGPGKLIRNDSVNLTVSNTIINSSANAIYGLDGTWPAP